MKNATPNPSIERDVQGLSPSTAPHVKRLAASNEATVAFLPTDWPSFLWGAALAGIAAFGTGFLQKAGQRAFAAFEKKINPKPPEPIQVGKGFEPTKFAPGDCVWVNEESIQDYETKGVGYYPHTTANARCFRANSNGKFQFKEYLMYRPGTKAKDAA